MPAIGAVWLLLWLAGSGALIERYLNRQGLFLQDMTGAAPASPVSVTARIMATQFNPASLRSLGGTELVVQVGGLEIPQRLLLGNASAALLKPGDTLALQLAPGRFNGLFITGWRVAPAALLPIKTP